MGRGRVAVVLKIIHFKTSRTYQDIESVSIKAQRQSRLVSTEEAVKGIGSRIVHNRLTMSKHERGNLKGGGSSRVNFSSSLSQLQRLTTSAVEQRRSLAFSVKIQMVWWDGRTRDGTWISESRPESKLFCVK